MDSLQFSSNFLYTSYGGTEREGEEWEEAIEPIPELIYLLLVDTRIQKKGRRQTLFNLVFSVPQWQFKKISLTLSMFPCCTYILIHVDTPSSHK